MAGGAGISRREFLVAAGGALGMGLLTPAAIEALAAAPACGGLGDIEHVVIFIQENRSFDHYFGTYPGSRGFDDHPVGNVGAFGQAFLGNKSRPQPGVLLPFHLDTLSSNAACVNDITHEWGPQHKSWNGGRMDRFVGVHTDPAYDGPDLGTVTMGYYARQDLAFYYALADAFTICDHYHCSMFGPTYPNRLYSMTATIDPGGKAGGPVITNPSAGPGDLTGIYSWTTMPERLQATGISWKVYNQAGTNNNMLPLFRQFHDPSSPLFQNALLPTFPVTFEADCIAGTLPQVSWVLTPMNNDEHPPSPSERGEFWTSTVLNALTANPKVWAKTVLFLTYDENGGFFDHVPPPVPADPQEPGEHLGVSPLPAIAEGIAGPIGLGFRVPALVISPFSRGGFVNSDVFDHTSLLRFIETRFGIEVPNLTSWRRNATGDLTSTLGLTAEMSIPVLPSPSPADPIVLRECTVAEIDGTAGNAPPYPLPQVQTMPVQEAGKGRRQEATMCNGRAGLRTTRGVGTEPLPNTSGAQASSGWELRGALLAAAAAAALGTFASEADERQIEAPTGRPNQRDTKVRILRP